MKSFNLKLRLIYYPFLLNAVGFILIYSFLNGWLTIQTTTISVKEEVTDLWLPLTLPFVLLAILLRSKINLLNLKPKPRLDLSKRRTTRADNLPLLYLIIAGFAIGIPSLLLQGYLRTSMGKLTPLQSISQIRENKLTRYYTAKNFYIDTSLASFKNISWVSGKNNQYLNYTIYIACPMFDKKPAVVSHEDEVVKIGPAPAPLKPITDSMVIDSHTGQDGDSRPEKSLLEDNPLPQAWTCVKYTEQISNRLGASEEKEKWKAFFESSLEDFSHKDFNQLAYLDRIGNTDDRDYYEKDIIKNPYFSTIPSPLLILEPRFTAFEARNGHKLGWVFGAFGIGALVWLIMLAIPKLKESVLEGEENAVTSKTGMGSIDLQEVKTLLLPRPGYTATPVIIDLNIIVFILLVLSGKGFLNFQSTDLLACGANYRPLTAGAGQWWRLLTSTFLHAGIMHLLFNMAGLLFAGILLEPALGKKRLAAVYLLTGIAASLTSLWWHPATVSVGASGAIFGLYGVFLALLSTRFFPPVFKKAFTVSVLIFVGGNLLMGLAGGIDNAAHIGGLISGLAAGYILYPRLKSEKEEQEGMFVEERP